MDDAQRAIGYFEQALAIHRESATSMELATGSFNLALLYAEQGDRPTALPLARRPPVSSPDGSRPPIAQRAQQLVAQLERQGQLTMQFHPSGTRIANRYEVAGRPLVGGMGIVYLCFDHQEQRPVALKTFKPEFLPDRAARERFLEEGNTWVRLGKHPHIVRAYSVERIGDGREVYLVLELVAKEEGRRDASLRSWLTPGQPLPADQALLIALQIVRGMRHATETIPGFVHRDLKPENVLVGADRLSNAAINRVRVTDFGLVKRAARRAGAGRRQASDLAQPAVAADPHRVGAGHAALHGAGAVGGRRRDAAGRHLRPGVHPGRDADRAHAGAGRDAG